MRILKFGGSSLSTPERIRSVTDIVAAARRADRVAVVVSAFGGVTDSLLGLARAAAAGEPDWRPRLGEIVARHREALEA
ncbi:MAG: aspartate kinase, partial [Gemmatimonadetes bacterium]|nr:aspartate kinase [Gemmatimonadota bacterium]